MRVVVHGVLMILLLACPKVCRKGLRVSHLQDSLIFQCRGHFQTIFWTRGPACPWDDLTPSLAVIAWIAVEEDTEKHKAFTAIPLLFGVWGRVLAEEAT